MKERTLPKNPNTTMHRSDLEIPEIRVAADAIQTTQKLLKEQGLKYSHWCGQLDDKPLTNGSTVANKGPDYQPMPWAFDDDNIPWFTLWEYSWLLHWSGLSRLESKSPKQRILSLGGSSSSFELTLARLGHHVTIVEQRPYTVKNTREVAAATGWDIHVIEGGIAGISSLLMNEAHQEHGPPYDFMVSSSVLFLAGEAAQAAVRRDLARLMLPGGRVCITFDYGNPNPKRTIDDPMAQFKLDGFKVWPHHGMKYRDNKKRYHFFYPDPDKGFYTAGALFLIKKA